MQCKERKNVVNERRRSHNFLVLLWVIIPSTSKSIFSVPSQFQYPVSPIGDDSSFVDIHLNIGKVFLRCSDVC